MESVGLSSWIQPSQLNPLFCFPQERTGVLKKYYRSTVAVMKEKWGYHIEERSGSRIIPAHFQTGRKSISRMF